ncbi:MAG: hypothetical protein ACOH1Q_12740 [Thiobacillus sp.]
MRSARRLLAWSSTVPFFLPKCPVNPSSGDQAQGQQLNLQLVPQMALRKVLGEVLGEVLQMALQIALKMALQALSTVRQAGPAQPRPDRIRANAAQCGLLQAAWAL